LFTHELPRNLISGQGQTGDSSGAVKAQPCGSARSRPPRARVRRPDDAVAAMEIVIRWFAVSAALALSQKEKKMFKGFRNFLMRGDVIVVAVGLIVALAFSTLIKAFTD